MPRACLAVCIENRKHIGASISIVAFALGWRRFSFFDLMNPRN